MKANIDTINNQVGPLIEQEVKLTEEITVLAERLHGAQHPEMIGAYHSQITEKRATLNEVGASLRQLRLQLIAAYEERHKLMSMTIQESHDAFEIGELESIQRAIAMKVDNLKKLV
jgi:hypothetical protein